MMTLAGWVEDAVVVQDVVEDSALVLKDVELLVAGLVRMVLEVELVVDVELLLVTGVLAMIEVEEEEDVVMDDWLEEMEELDNVVNGGEVEDVEEVGELDERGVARTRAAPETNAMRTITTTTITKRAIAFLLCVVFFNSIIFQSKIR